MRIYIFGPQGVGKTTIAELYANSVDGMVSLSSSKVMMDICNVRNREELRALSREEKNLIEEEHFLPYLSKHQNLILDGHGDLTEEQIEFFDVFIFLTTSPEILLERRIRDTERMDRKMELDSIFEEYDVYAERAMFIQKQGFNVETVSNDANVWEAVLGLDSKISECKEARGLELKYELKNF